MTRLAASQERNNPEHQEQAALFAHMALLEDKYPDLTSIFAVPNGEYRPPQVGARLKEEGVKAGVLDICVPVPRFWTDTVLKGVEIARGLDYNMYVGLTPGLWVEMKAPGRCKDSTYGTSAEQRTWATIFAERGWAVVVVDDWKAAWEEIKSYLGISLEEPYL